MSKVSLLESPLLCVKEYHFKLTKAVIGESLLGGGLSKGSISCKSIFDI